MFKYFATKGNVMEAVISLQSDLLDFADYGCCVTEPEHKWEVYGWVKTGKKLSQKEQDVFSLKEDRKG